MKIWISKNWFHSKTQFPGELNKTKQNKTDPQSWSHVMSITLTLCVREKQCMLGLTLLIMLISVADMSGIADRGGLLSHLHQPAAFIHLSANGRFVCQSADSAATQSLFERVNNECVRGIPLLLSSTAAQTTHLCALSYENTFQPCVFFKMLQRFVPSALKKGPVCRQRQQSS